MISLGTLGGESSEATAINDASTIVGVSRNAQNERGMFLYERGQMNLLGEFQPYDQRPMAINDRRIVVGVTADASGISAQAFLWANGVFYDLNQLTTNLPHTKLAVALGINAANQILASATDGNHYLLHPVA